MTSDKARREDAEPMILGKGLALRLLFWRMMKEFIMVALPWAATGLCAAVLAVHTSRKESKKSNLYWEE